MANGLESAEALPLTLTVTALLLLLSVLYVRTYVRT